MQIRTKGELYLTKAECKKPREQTRISPGTKNKVANKNRNQNPKTHFTGRHKELRKNITPTEATNSPRQEGSQRLNTQTMMMRRGTGEVEHR